MGQSMEGTMKWSVGALWDRQVCNYLLILAALGDGARSVLQRLADSRNDWSDEWRQQTHDEYCYLLTDSLHQLLQTRNLGNCGGNGAYHIVAELQDRVNY